MIYLSRFMLSGCKITTKIAHTQKFGCFSSNKMQFFGLNGIMGHLCLQNSRLCVCTAGRDRTFEGNGIIFVDTLKKKK